MPICPSGHKLRSSVLGNLTELPLPLALLRGFFVCSMTLLLGMLEDIRFTCEGRRPFGLIFMTGTLLVLGIIAFGDAWLWAGRPGPVNRLTTRACGMALGTLIPAVVACHALYFHWSTRVQSQLMQGMTALVKYWIRQRGLS